MDLTLEKLVRKAHTFFNYMTNYYERAETSNEKLILELSKINPFSEEFMKRVQDRDINITEAPYLFSEELINDTDIDSNKIQDMINFADKFINYEPEIFGLYGIFISVMMNKYLINNKNLDIDTMNNSKVHISDYYENNDGIETSYPWRCLEKIKEYNRDNLLISNLVSRLKKGTIKVKGNVGNFFAKRSSCDIELNGECGWRSCYGLSGGVVKINGTTGHDLAEDAKNGTICVEGEIRSIGSYYTAAYKHEIFLNGRKMPKKLVSLNNSINN